MLDPEAVQAALLATAGETQALMNQMGLAARSAHTARVLFDSDIRTLLRRSLQMGRAELVHVDAPLGKNGILAQPTHVVVTARTKVPQLAVEIRLHPRGEDHAGFSAAALGSVAKMALARSRGGVEQAAVLVAAPARFWRWLPGYAEDRPGYELLGPAADTPANAESGFLAGAAWDPLFDEGLDRELPERFWSSLLASGEARSPWIDIEFRLLEVKGLGAVRDARS